MISVNTRKTKYTRSDKGSRMGMRKKRSRSRKTRNKRSKSKKRKKMMETQMSSTTINN